MTNTISICIPAYNRPTYLNDLLESIALQRNFRDYEIVISDDNSPLHDEIAHVITNFENKYDHKKLVFNKNQETLGYDGNFRKLLSLATSDFCFYMGDDDLICEGALEKIESVISRYSDIGVILRGWYIADRDTVTITERFRYFKNDRYFPPNEESVVTFFRRSVQIAGFVIRRLPALSLGTEKYDGTLLYQLYLSANVVIQHGGYYIDDFLTIMRKDLDLKATHFFGTAKAEQNKFTPGQRPTSTSLNFINGMLEIARDISINQESDILYQNIVSDLDNYSYPLLNVQRDKGVLIFSKYTINLIKVGFGRSVYFYIYYFILLLFGNKISQKLINFFKIALGKTPKLGRFSEGYEVNK